MNFYPRNPSSPFNVMGKYEKAKVMSQEMCRLSEKASEHLTPSTTLTLMVLLKTFLFPNSSSCPLVPPLN